MEHFVKSMFALGQKRQREIPGQVSRKKLHVIRPLHGNSANFYFPRQEISLLNSSDSIYQCLISPGLSSTEETKARVELIKETIIYAQKKLRKLSGAKLEFSEAEAAAVYKEWYNEEKPSELKCLAPGRDLTLKVVESYVKLLPTPQSMHILSPNVYCSIDRILEEPWEKRKYEAALSKEKITSILDRPFVILPVKEETWGLICVNNECKTIEYYSSDRENDYRLPCSKLEKLLCLSEDIGEYDWEIVECPQVNCKTDSGVFMLLILRALSFNSDFTFAPENVEYFRTAISLEIKNRALYNY